jgi:hypothetical protein
MAEGVIVFGDRRRRRRVTVAKDTGARGGNSSADLIESWEEVGGGRVAMGGANSKRTTFGLVVDGAGVGAGLGVGFGAGDGAVQLRKAL